MAVVQISKIQIRRGQKNVGSGIPQLSSGELGWAIDSQELYVGNGAVSEGSPKVGNTKVLTEHDNLFTLIDTYSYRTNDPYVVTGENATNPINRTLQDRLDDTVSGIGEALEAGCWGVGIARYSNYMDMDTLEEAQSLPKDEIQRRLVKTRDILQKAGAHYVINTFDELPGVVEEINLRLSKGERP